SETVNSLFPAPTADRPHALSSTTVAGGGSPSNQFTYDASGNLTGTSPVGGNPLAYEWDDEGLLASVKDLSTNEKMSFVYDAEGQRLITRDESTGDTTLHLGDTELVRNASNQLSSRRYYSIGDETV